MIELTCPSCGATYRLKEELAGSRVRCVKCKGAIRIPPSAAGEGASADPPRSSSAVTDEMSDLRSALVAASDDDDDSGPAATPADDIPMASPVDGRKRLLLVGAAAAGGLLVVGLLIAMLWGGRPYDLDELDAAARRIQKRAEELVPGPIPTLTLQQLVDANDGLPGVIDEYEQFRQRLAPLAEQHADDAELGELVAAVASRGRIARADLGRVGEKLWPRPGSFGQMSKRVAPSVPIVIVRGQGRSGSGFLIKFGHRLYVVTNRHVIERGKDGFTLRFLLDDRTGSRGPLDVVVPAEAVELIHRHADLAVLSLGEKARDIDAERLRPLKLDNTVEVEEDVWVVGHPGAGEHGILEKAFDKGYVSAVKDDSPGDPGLFRFAAPVNKGNSGGPVLDADGRVVGIVFGGVPGKSKMSFAVHIRKLHELLADRGGDRGWTVKLSPEEVRRLVQPEQQFAKDFDEIVAHMKSRDYARCEWTDPDTKPFFVLALGKPEVFEFQARKGNFYRIVVLAARLRKVDFVVSSKASGKPVFFNLTRFGSAGKTRDGFQLGADFEAAETGTHVVQLENSTQREPIPCYTGILTQPPR